ncbi:MAG: branched-chain amino acid ABC transporter permease [Phreatobacter sp.]|uniref:branched-chain amino acid ABC transporter permease n=1 Tax=Phreatobacter sp. TaxID=1966341 RepID=UPI001A51C2CA|nr:branched-chain amino acid ABC transporter permease [Phreatobacter sp.]MBL8567623.1 branched-chain amino acid ABC transporter permease [Phreatobacter sp.]
MSATYLQALLSGLSVGGIYALIALSFSITFTTTKTLNFSQGEFVSFGAFVGLSVLLLLSGTFDFNAVPADASAGLKFPIAVATAGVVVGVVGIFIFLLAVRPFAGKPGMSWVMSTIGFGIILQSLGLVVWGPAVVNVPAPLGEGVIRIFGAGVRSQELVVLVSAIVIMLVFDQIMRRSLLGKAMRAVAFSPQVASLMGINVTLVMVGAFVMSGVLAGFAGVMVAPISTASLFMGLGFSLKAFAGAIIGGLNNPRGCIFGGFMLGVIESFVGLWHSEWREISVFVLIILVLAVRPDGLFGARTVDKV